MPDGIPEVTEFTVRGGFHDPDKRAIRRRMDLEDRLIFRQIRHPGLVELEDGLRRFSGNPLGLGVAQGVEIEFRAFHMTVAAGQGKVVGFGNFREPRAGGIWRMDVDGMDGNEATDG